MIPRVVIDTNIYISAMMFGGLPDQLLRLAANRAIEVSISETGLREIHGTLQRRFSSTEAQADEAISQILRFAKANRPVETVDVCRDPRDNHILECAIAAQADYILTGDNDLLVLDPFRRTRVLTVRVFLENYFTPTEQLP